MVARGCWIQLNVALRRHGGSALESARTLFAVVETLVLRWRVKGALDCFFFMRKAPDVRLRFRAPSARGAASLRRTLAVSCRALTAARSIGRSFFSPYEPEVFRFGGPETMELVHAVFFADSLAWMDLDRASVRQRRRLDTEELMLAVINDLFARALQDSAEIWDTWCNVVVTMQADQLGRQAPREAVGLDDLMAVASPAERRVLRRYQRTNTRLAWGLQRVWRAGRLRRGLRELLPHIALFQLHRHGLPAARQAVLAQQMVEAWDPSRFFKKAR